MTVEGARTRARIAAIIPWATLVALSVVLHVGLSSWPFDDAFIHLRVAERLLDTGEPFYNPGERVMASSSPVWTLLLAGLFALLPREPSVVAGLNALLCGLGAGIFAALSRRLSQAPLHPVAAWSFGALYLGIDPPFEYAHLGHGLSTDK